MPDHTTPDEIDWGELLRIADRGADLAESRKKLEAIGDELDGGAYKNAAILGLIDPTTGSLDTKKFAAYRHRQASALAREFPDHLRREALRKFEDAASFEEPQFDFNTLQEALQLDIEPMSYRIEDLAIKNGNTSVAAQYKSGKSTLMFNLLKSLADGTPFLGKQVTPLAEGRTVAFYDFELDKKYCVEQLRKLGIAHPERVVLRNYRGHKLPLTTDRAKEFVIGDLTDNAVEVWITDPFAAVYTGDENSNEEVNEWLRAVEEIKRKSSVTDWFLVTHTGRTTEGKTRSRGATRLDDYPDVRWTWEAVKHVDRRRLTAHGRSVDQPEILAEWEPATNLYRCVDQDDEGGEAQTYEEKFQQKIWTYLRANPDSNIKMIVEGLEFSSAARNKVSPMLKGWEATGLVESRVGQHGAKYYSVTYLASADPPPEAPV